MTLRFAKVLLPCTLLLLPLALAGQSSLPDAPVAKPIVYQPGKDGVSVPKLVYSVDPEYTSEARKHRLRGTVTLTVIVDEKGKVTLAKVAHSLGESVDPKYRAAAEGLDDKAVEAVSQYRFKPATLNGKPVSVTLPLEVNFQLF